MPTTRATAAKNQQKIAPSGRTHTVQQLGEDHKGFSAHQEDQENT
jgi:hypothetical protein